MRADAPTGQGDGDAGGDAEGPGAARTAPPELAAKELPPTRA